MKMTNILAFAIIMVLFFAVLNTIEAKNKTKLNNPFNIMSSKHEYLGETTKDTKFESFKNVSFSTAAFLDLLERNYLKKGYNTIETILNRYAPPHENDTEKYINYVSNQVGINKKSIVVWNTQTQYAFCKSFAFYESGYKLTYNEFLKAKMIQKFSIFFNK